MGSSMRDRWLLAGMILLLGVLVISFNLPKASNMKIVFFDDVHLDKSVPDFYASNGWLYMRKGLLSPSVKIQNSILTISAQFTSSEDEWIVFQRKIEIDTLDYPFLTFSWRTSTNRPGDPGVFLEFSTASGRTIIQPLGISKEWTTSTIHLLSLTSGEGITGVGFKLDDWDDSISSGLFFIQIRDIHLYPIIDLRNVSLLVVSGGVFALTIIDSYARKSKLNKAILAMANIGFMSVLPSLVLPFFQLPGVEIILSVSIAITFGLTLLKRRIKENELARLNNARMTSYIALLIGLLTIPWLAFLLRLNYATMPTAFGDETSYGIMSWGILKGKFAGLYLPGPWLQQNIPEFFRIEEYPRDLPLPYTTDWMSNLKIVSPFLLPFLCPLISAPLIAFFGFSVITIRFAYVLMSTISVVFTFLIGRHFSNRIGLIAAGTLAVLSFSAHYGSRAFMDNGVLLFFVVTVFLYLRFKETSKHKYLYLAAISAGLCALTKLAIGFLAIIFLIVALLFDLKKRREITKILLISLGIFSIFIIGSLLISYQALIWVLLYFAWYAPALAVQGGQAWMAEPLMLLNYPELVFGLICLLYVLGGKDDFSKFVKLLLLSVIALIMFAKPMWLLSILPLLSLSIAKAFSHGSNGDDIIIKRTLLLIFAALATKYLPVIREFFIVFFGGLLVFTIITHFTTSLRFDFFKNKGLIDKSWITFIVVILATLYIQNTLMVPL